ncbi:hypothetical protein ACNHOZ_08655 [Priestia sp. D51]
MEGIRLIASKCITDKQFEGIIQEKADLAFMRERFIAAVPSEMDEAGKSQQLRQLFKD